MLFGFVTVQVEALFSVSLPTLFSCFCSNAAIAVTLELGSPRVDRFPWGFHTMVLVVFELFAALPSPSKIEGIYDHS